MAASSPLINEVNASDTEFSDREQSLEFNAQEVLQIDEVCLYPVSVVIS